MRELREHAEALVKIVCLALAVLVVWELRGMVHRWNPFHGVTVPELPALASATNNIPALATHPTNPPATALAVGKATNHPPSSPSSNAIPLVAAPPAQLNNNLNTNTVSAPGTNLATLAMANPTTNTPVRLAANATGTNPAPALLATNPGANPMLAAAATGTNAADASTNSTAKPRKHKSGPAALPEMSGMAGMGFNPGQMPGKRGPDLPPAVQARISRITDSEILAPVMHPLPMGLLGIAGQFAFLRSNSGQTGLVKEGDSLDDLKLLRIGINRVLIEQDGQKKELMIFSGYGGESLLPNDSTNENNHP